MLLSNYMKEMIAEANLTASFSKDPSTKVGAVACKNKRILAKGRNGFPAGIPDTPSMYDNRANKLLLTTHAEINLISHAAAAGHSLQGSDLFVTFPVCNECAKSVIGAGVKNVYVPFREKRDEWWYRWKLAGAMFLEVGINCYEYEEDRYTEIGFCNIIGSVFDLNAFLKGEIT